MGICFVKGANIVEKGENAGYKYFLLVPQCFEKATFSGLLKVGIVWQRVQGTLYQILFCKLFIVIKNLFA